MNMFGLTFDSNTHTAYLTSIDPTTGAVMRIGDGLSGVAGVDSGIEVATEGKFYFAGENSLHTSFLYVADEATGQLIAALPSSASEFALDGWTGPFIGLTYDMQASTEYLTSIDPTTGAVTRLGNGLSGVATIAQANEVAAGGRFYFAGSDASQTGFLYVADEGTGQLIAALPSSAANFAIDGTTGEFIGLTYDSQTSTEYLTSIDPNTGAVTRIGNGLPGVAGVGQGNVVATGGKFYFAGSNSSNATFLYVADETTGRLVTALPSSAEEFAIDVTPVTCFAAGTRIATPSGATPVEHLRENDLVLTISGKAQPIQWIGRRTLDCRRHAAPDRVNPIRIVAHAFGHDRPKRPLLLSPDHAVFVEDILVPIKHLLNDTTIVQIETGTVTYYHIELPCHDVILAEGLPTESYLETGNRATAFENVGVPMQLHPDFAPDEARVAMVWQCFAYAPLLSDEAQLTPLRARLDLQATLLGYQVGETVMRRAKRAP